MRFFTVKTCLFYSTRQHRFPFCSLQYEISIRPAFEARLSRVIHKVPLNFPSKSLCCCMVMQFIGKVTISHYVLSPVPGGSRRKFRGQQNGFGASVHTLPVSFQISLSPLGVRRPGEPFLFYYKSPSTTVVSVAQLLRRILRVVKVQMRSCPFPFPSY